MNLCTTCGKPGAGTFTHGPEGCIAWLRSELKATDKLRAVEKALGEARAANVASLKAQVAQLEKEAGAVPVGPYDLTVGVVDVSGDGGGPFKLMIGSVGIAQFHPSKEYADEVARCVKLALSGYGPEWEPSGSCAPRERAKLQALTRELEARMHYTVRLRVRITSELAQATAELADTAQKLVLLRKKKR